MTIQAKIALWLASIAVVFALFFSAYEYGRHVESLKQTAERDKAIQEQQDKNTKDLLAYAEQIKKGQIENDQNRALIARMHADTNRLRVHFPASALCAEAQPNPNSDGTSGMVPNRVDEVFAELQRRAGELFERCDQINADAIRLNGDIKQ